MLRMCLVIGIAVSMAGCFPWRTPKRIPEFTSLEEARKSDAEVKFLNLNDQNLESVPAGLDSIAGLERLSLRKNKIALPGSSLAGLKNLVWLDLAEMGLKTVPGEVASLTRLAASSRFRSSGRCVWFLRKSASI